VSVIAQVPIPGIGQIAQRHPEILNLVVDSLPFCVSGLAGNRWGLSYVLQLWDMAKLTLAG